MECPFRNKRLRPELPPLPPRIAQLPIDERGYPVPWFVSWPNGKPEFRMIDGRKIGLAHVQRLCWVCGQKLKGPKTFVIGPMCAVNRNSGEPPSHQDCAEFSVKACPFIMRPNMERREDDFTRKYSKDAGGIMLRRNPGVVMLWTTQAYERYSDGMGGQLFRIGDPLSISWWREGRTATREEIMGSIDSGLPLLAKHCANQQERDQLQRMYQKALTYIPAQ